MLESLYSLGANRQPAKTQALSPLAAYIAHSVKGPVSTGGRPFPGTPQLPPDERVGTISQPVDPASFASAPAGAPAGAAVATPAALPAVTTDYSSDPVLQKMLLGGERSIADAESQALTARRNALGAYGDKNLAARVLGAGDPTISSISDNPDTSTSTLARLKRGYASTVKSNNDQLNAENLFYGGYRTKVLGDLAKNEQTSEADASSAVQQALDQIASSLSSTKSSIMQSEQNAEDEAYNRALQNALLQALLQGASSPGSDAGPTISAGSAPAPMAQPKTSLKPGSFTQTVVPWNKRGTIKAL